MAKLIPVEKISKRSKSILILTELKQYNIRDIKMVKIRTSYMLIFNIFLFVKYVYYLTWSCSEIVQLLCKYTTSFNAI